MLRLPLRERESRLHGEDRVQRAGVVARGRENSFELEHVVAAVTNIERPEEVHRTVFGDRITAVDREQLLARAPLEPSFE